MSLRCRDVAWLALLVITVSADAAERRPNVLFIAVDDLRPEVAASGSDVIRTPNIDRIARRGPATEAADVPDETYLDGKVARLAARTLAELKARGQPFFLAVGMAKPHLPFVAPKRYWDLYDPATIYAPGFQELPRDAPPYAGHDNGELHSYADMPKQGPISTEVARHLRHGYYAATSYMDAQIGVVLDDSSARVRDVAISQFPRQGRETGGRSLMGYSIRDDRWRLTLWRDRTDGTIVARELYDERDDPHETTNVAMLPEHAAVVSRLTERLPATVAPVAPPRSKR